MTVSNRPGTSYDIVIVGAGSAGIATASSLLKRNGSLRIALIDPSSDHYYQPGWTMVGGGIFEPESTHRKTADLIPAGVDWIAQSVTGFAPDDNSVSLDNDVSLIYRHLVVAPGLKLDWAAVEGLEETLGKNGVTSNYRYDLAPYTWQLVQGLDSGKALFTQPPMPIKCAGAPQKALYLSASQWLTSGKLPNIDIEFYNAGGALFGVPAYVPALTAYMEKYGVGINYLHNLIKVDGARKTAWFKTADAEGNEQIVESRFDMLHVCPPQCAPDLIKNSELSGDGGWLEVDPASLQHKRYPNIWGAGDVMDTANAKTMAAARKQAPVVAQNICDAIAGQALSAAYKGYGSCPLTVENGKIVLAEFSYGGEVTPTFPGWLNEGTKPTRLAWFLKVRILPLVYWYGMLKAREWLAGP
jgi:sulfide:quinone oxidoreductase